MLLGIGLAKLSKLLLMLLLVTLIASCETMGLSEKTSNGGLLFCDGYEPLYWHEKDTKKTIEQAKRNNAVYLSECRK